MNNIYFDHAATTSVDSRVFEAMKPYFCDDFGNSSSIHSFGQKAAEAVDKARDQVAKLLNCSIQEVVFTSGATEANNIAILGVLNRINGILPAYVTPYAKASGVKKTPAGRREPSTFTQVLVDKQYDKKVGHFITTKVEHPAVLEVYKKIEKMGHEVTFVEVDEKGVVKLDQLEAAIKDNTVLVSVMYANNEVGAVNPIKEIGRMIEKKKTARGADSLPLYFHTDAVQAINYLDTDVKELMVDFLAFSGHKVYGPKGIGVLYVRAGVKIAPLMQGGHQEWNLRPGTLNVPGIVGLGRAVELLQAEKAARVEHITTLKKALIEAIKQIDEVRIFSSENEGLPNVINVSFYRAEGESILMMLDMDGIAISTGSACSSGALEPSHVLMAMGIEKEWTHGSIRVSFGKDNTVTEVENFIEKIKPIVNRLREMAPEIR